MEDYHLAGLSEEDKAKYLRPGVVTVKCQRCEMMQSQRDFDVALINGLTKENAELRQQLTQQANENMRLDRPIDG